jgi:hypothetical protein
MSMASKAFVGTDSRRLFGLSVCRLSQLVSRPPVWLSEIGDASRPFC